MQISTVKNIQSNIVNPKNKISFTSNAEVDKDKKKNGNVLVMAGLAALSVVGICIVAKGKKSSGNTNDPIAPVQDMTIKAFKQAGNKFKQGVAKLADGGNYTGKITHTLKDGAVVTVEYKDGILQTAKKIIGEDQIFDKMYHYDKDSGKLLSVTYKTEEESDDAMRFLLKKIYDSDGSLKYLYNSLTSAFYMDKLCEFSADGKLKTMFASGPMRNQMFTYDKNGNIVKTIYKPLRYNGLSDGRRFYPCIPNYKGDIIMGFENSGKKYSWDTFINSKIDNGKFGKFTYIDTITTRKDKIRFEISISTTEEGRLLDIERRVKKGKSVGLSKKVGDDLAEIILSDDSIAKYNIKTRSVELPRGSSHNEEEVRNIAEGLLKEAGEVKNEIVDHQKDVIKYEELMNMLESIWRGK